MNTRLRRASARQADETQILNNLFFLKMGDFDSLAPARSVAMRPSFRLRGTNSSRRFPIGSNALLSLTLPDLASAGGGHQVSELTPDLLTEANEGNEGKKYFLEIALNNLE